MIEVVLSKRCFLFGPILKHNITQKRDATFDSSLVSVNLRVIRFPHFHWSSFGINPSVALFRQLVLNEIHYELPEFLGLSKCF